MKCPYCAEEIDDNSKECIVCHEKLVNTCISCKKEIAEGALKCKHCGEMQNSRTKTDTIQPKSKKTLAYKIRMSILLVALAATIVFFFANKSKQAEKLELEVQEDLVSTLRYSSKVSDPIGGTMVTVNDFINAGIKTPMIEGGATNLVDVWDKSNNNEVTYTLQYYVEGISCELKIMFRVDLTNKSFVIYDVRTNPEGGASNSSIVGIGGTID